MSLGTSNRDGGKTSESGHLRALGKIVTGDIITGLNAVQRAAGVNMSVDIQVGDAFVRRSDGTYSHPVFNDAVYNQVISAADGSNPRRDIVVIYVDYGQTPSTAVSNNTNGVVKIKVVNGTPAGSPVDPNAAAIQASVGAGNPYSILARVRVPAGQTTISNSLIDDLRIMTTAVVTDLSITTAKLANGAVTPDKWTNLYKFSAYRGAALTTVATTFSDLIYDTELFDTSNNYNNTTGVFTAPVAGFYQFNATLTLGAVSRLFLSFVKNGTEYSRGTDLQAGTGGIQNSVFMQLAANDTVKVQYFTGSAAAVNNSLLTQFSGYLVSKT